MPRRKKNSSYLLPVLFFILAPTALILVLKIHKSPQSAVLSSKSPYVTPTPQRIPFALSIPVVHQSITYSILAAPVYTSSTLSLIPNFSHREYVDTIASKSGCMVAINGGFYKGDTTPLGLFYTNGKSLSAPVKSNVANGFFLQDKLGQYTFSKTAPTNLSGYSIAMQTGPLIAVVNKSLGMASDERARRSLLGLDQQNNLFLISIRTKDASYAGPYLADIPIIFSKVEVQEKLPLTHLLNLDGGGASFYYTHDEADTYYLSSLSPVGSVLCLKYQSPTITATPNPENNC